MGEAPYHERVLGGPTASCPRRRWNSSLSSSWSAPSPRFACPPLAVDVTAPHPPGVIQISALPAGPDSPIGLSSFVWTGGF